MTLKNQTSYGLRSIKFEGTKLWNHLPEDTKSAENLNIFKKLIKDWTGPSCGLQPSPLYNYM